MKKALILSLILSVLVSCAKKEIKPQKLNYSLFDEIYKTPSQEVKSIVGNVVERRGKVLKVPKYIKVLRGSYKDENGNVVESGFEWIRVDDGIPDTNF